MQSARKFVGFKQICAPYEIIRPTRRHSAQWQMQTCNITEAHGPIEPKIFGEIALKPEKPLVMRVGGSKLLPAEDVDLGFLRRGREQLISEIPVYLPAFAKWFQKDGDRHGKVGLAPFLSAFANAEVIYELSFASEDLPALKGFFSWLSTTQDAASRVLAECLEVQLNTEIGPGTRFIRFNAPLGLILAAAEYNEEFFNAKPVTQLYVAQIPLGDLPSAMQADLPAPDLVRSGGRGDIYSSSFWIGLHPTYTPWHRDPNPNLFVQLQGNKTVKMLPPGPGLALFNAVKTRLGLSDSASIRTEEMMRGGAREAFWQAVWGDDAGDDFSTVTVHPGDALHIPKGWWHSVASRRSSGVLNASVNWWFR